MEFERDEVGAEIARLLPMGAVSYHNYDLSGQVTSILHAKSDGTVPVALYYSYDDDGRRTNTERDQVGSRYATYFGYDDASRLVSEEWLDGGGSGVYAFSWEYDAAGNRTAQVRNGTPTYCDYNTLNELTHEETDGAHTYHVYNDNGHLTRETDVGGTTYFSWASDDRLRRVRKPDGEAWTYRYLMGSQRWRKRHDDVEELTDFVYDGEKVAEEIDYDAANQATYTHAGRRIYSPLLAQRTGGTSGWFLQDALGSTLGLLDSDEALLLQVMYDAWGNELLATGSLETPYSYVGAYGYYRDTETDLLYLWMRYYDRTTGRFIRRDPVPAREMSDYPYAANAPAIWLDVSGEQVAPDPPFPRLVCTVWDTRAITKEWTEWTRGPIYKQTCHFQSNFYWLEWDTWECWGRRYRGTATFHRYWCWSPCLQGPTGQGWLTGWIPADLDIQETGRAHKAIRMPTGYGWWVSWPPIGFGCIRRAPPPPIPAGLSCDS